MTTKSCAKCEALPLNPSMAGRLFLWPPEGHGLAALVQRAKNTGLESCVLGSGACVAIKVHEGQAPSLASDLLSALSGAETEHTLALFMPGQGEPGVGDFARTKPLEALAAQWREQWLIDMLAEERLTCHFQPIFPASDTHRPFAHECLMRGLSTEGDEIPPFKLLDAAKRTDLLFRLDRDARATAVRRAGEAGIDGAIFINFTPTSIYNPRHCLRTTMALVEAHQIPHENIVFEVIETEKITDLDHLADILKFYRECGFRVALDDLGAGYSSLNLLPHLRPDFVKIDRELITNVDQDHYKQIVVGRLISMAKDLHIKVIAEGIERRGELSWLQARGVDYVQGYLLARPKPHPFERLAA